MRISRRELIGAAGATGIAGAVLWLAGRGSEASAGTFEINLTPEQWRNRLTAEQYRVLRRQGTERAGSSPLDGENRRGTFLCAGCGLPVFRSQDKFDSGTGWPSFMRPIRGAVQTRPDNTLLMTRTEAHCRRCGGHLGHVFEDGPPPTGQRWCINGVAMTFAAARG